jgi:hypothetical protein
MALVGCTYCGQTVSSEATVCVHCGSRLDPRRTRIDYVTGETVGIRPRAAAHAARPPLRRPTSAGVALMSLGATAVVLGSLLPWVRTGGVSQSGLRTDGRYTLVIGVVMLILALASRSSFSRLPRLLVMVGAVLVGVIAFVDNSRLADDVSGTLIGPGVRVVLVGGIVAFVGSLLRSR